MSGVKGTKNLSEKEFNNIKLMQQAGLKQSHAMDITKRSSALISIIFRQPSWESYQEYNRSKAVAKANRTKKVESPAPPQDNQNNSVVAEDVKLILEKLETIDGFLNHLVTVLQDKESRANISFWKR